MKALNKELQRELVQNRNSSIYSMRGITTIVTGINMAGTTVGLFTSEVVRSNTSKWICRGKLSSSAAKNISKIQSFAKLEKNWDSYNGSPPSRNTIQNSISFVKKLDSKSQEVYFVAPGPSGEILIELKNQEKSIEFFINENDDIEFIAFRVADTQNEGMIKSDEDLSKLIAWMNVSI